MVCQVDMYESSDIYRLPQSPETSGNIQLPGKSGLELEFVDTVEIPNFLGGLVTISSSSSNNITAYSIYIGSRFKPRMLLLDEAETVNDESVITIPYGTHWFPGMIATAYGKQDTVEIRQVAGTLPLSDIQKLGLNK